jgi:hypothetical protein
MKNIKKMAAATMMMAVLMVGTGFANKGLLVSDFAGSGKDKTCTQTASTDKKGVILQDLTGVVIGGFTGVVIGGFTGVVIGGFTGVVIGGVAETPVNCGVVIGG